MPERVPVPVGLTDRDLPLPTGSGPRSRWLLFSARRGRAQPEASLRRGRRRPLGLVELVGAPGDRIVTWRTPASRLRRRFRLRGRFGGFRRRLGGRRLWLVIWSHQGQLPSPVDRRQMVQVGAASDQCLGRLSVRVSAAVVGVGVALHGVVVVSGTASRLVRGAGWLGRGRRGSVAPRLPPVEVAARLGPQDECEGVLEVAV